MYRQVWGAGMRGPGDFSIAALVLIFILAHGAIQAQPNGLVAAYSFNEGTGTTAADTSGNGNNGTINAATWTSSGKYGGALVFNGSSALVTINNSASLRLTTSMTLEAWVNPSSASSLWRDVLYKGNDIYYLEGTSTTSGRPAMGGTFSASPLYGTAALAVNTWAHLAATYDGTNLRLYVNGTQLASRAQTGNIATSTNPVQIGGDSLYGQFFQGMIDEVRIYNVALTAAQIQSDMNTPIAPDTQAPTAPTNLTATAISGTQINLRWAASTDNVGVTGYLVERQGAGSSSFVQIGTTNGTSYGDTGLTSNTNYSYRVRATDAAGNLSGYSLVASATTQASDTQPPTAPTNLTATAVSGTQINLSWAAATDNAGVTGYLVERQGPGSSTFAQVGTPNGTTYNDTGLAPNSNYSYRVRARDAAGNLSAYSLVAGATTLSAPSGLVAAYSFNEGTGSTVADTSGNGNNGTMSGATWTTLGKYGSALTFNGSSALVTINNSASLQLTTGMTLEAWVNPSSTSSLWRDLIYKGNDIIYLEATSSNSGRPAMGGTFSASPLYGTAALAVNTWAHLAATYDGANLRLYVNGTQVASRAQTGNIASSTNPVQIGGDSLYGQFFQGMIDEVRIYNVALTAAQIQSDMNTPVAPDTQAPTTPSNLTATAVSGSQINLRWAASTDNVGVTGYLVERQGAGSSSFVQIGTTNGTSYGDTGLTSNTNYSYRVRATDAAGNLSGYSLVASATTQAPDTQPPTAPTNLTATAVSGTQINLSWVAATDNVGVTGYRLERCQGPSCSSFIKLAYPTDATYSDTGLTPNTSYSYIVRATDAAGNLGPYSGVATATTIAAPPSLVAAYSFNEGSGTAVGDLSGNGNNGTVNGATWTASGKYGGGLVFNGTGALVTINDSASLHLASGMTLEAWINPSTVSSAWRDVLYKGNDLFYLEATSSSSGHPAMGGTFGTADITLYGPSALTANTWTHLAATYDGTTAILYVNGTQVASRAQTGNIATSANPLQIGGDSLYGQFFKGTIDEVRIYNTAATAAQIQTDMNTPLGNIPAAPGSLTASAASGSQINLSWSASSGNIGIAGYQIERCQGGGCTSFTQIGTTSLTTYSDTGLAANTSYSYRVRAFDTLGNLSPYSSVATAFTGLTLSPRVAVLTSTGTQLFTASVGGVTWSVDGVPGGSSSVGTINPSGLYSPPGAVGTHVVTATSSDQSQSASATVYVSGFTGKLTHHNDNFRTSQNLNEIALTPANVTAATFGKLGSYTLDGVTHASPLYMASVNIPGSGFHNIVFVATEHNSVFAFDADGLSSSPLWHKSFINPAAGVTTVPANDTGECCDIAPEIGITSTPVIDPASGTLYAVAKTKEVSGNTTSYVQRMHALDITTGAEKFGGPVVIQASVPGTGSGSSGGRIGFDPLHENQRPALLLNNGVVYLAFASHGDNSPWHGWVLGYSASTLVQMMAYNVTPNASGGGIWQSGGGPAGDAAGNIYFVTGNGPFDANTGGPDYGDSFVKLATSGTVADYFTPHIQGTLNSQNKDLGSGGIMLVPDQAGSFPHLLLSAGKDGTIYLINRDNMGHYNANNDSQIVQSLVNIFPRGTPEPGNYSAPAYFNGQVYFSPIADTMQAFRFTNGLLSTAPASKTSRTYAYPGAALAISANGGANGILWAIQFNGVVAPGMLVAYDAGNLATELYNSNQAGSRDTMDFAAKYTVPLVANGKVFAASVSQLAAYGLLP